MPAPLHFAELESFLRNFFNIDGGPVPYDFGGVLMLWLALIDNMRANTIDADLNDAAGYVRPEQLAFLTRLTDRIRAGPGEGSE